MAPNDPLEAPLPRVLYVDATLLVVDKPSGLLSVPGRGESLQDCVSRRIEGRWPDARVVHRLDRDTSGLMLMARGLAAQRLLADAFARRAVEKRYVAVVQGDLPTPVAPWGEIDLPIAADWPRRPRRIVDAATGKPSITRWRLVPPAQGPGRTRLELSPLTGRTHQLRVHLQAIGHPIVGDPLYGTVTEATGERLLLHATELRLAHPLDGRNLAFCSPAPF